MLSKREVSLIAALREEHTVLAAKVAALKMFLAAYDEDHGGNGGRHGSAVAVVRLDSGQRRDAAIIRAARTLLRRTANGSVSSGQILKQLEAEGIDLRVKLKTFLISSCLKRYSEFQLLTNKRWTFRLPEKPEAVLAGTDDEHIGEQQAFSSDDTPPDMGADEAISSDGSSAAELGEGIDDAADNASDAVQGSGPKAGAAQFRDAAESSSVIDGEAGPDAEGKPEQPATDDVDRSFA